MTIENPFPERGVATRETFYTDYWARKNNRFKDFLININDSEKAQRLSQFLVVAGDLGSGKTATLYHMERQIQETLNNNALVLFWQLSTPIKNQSVIQSFYNDFLNQLQKFLIKNHNAAHLIGSTVDIRVNEILNMLDIQQSAELVDLLTELHNIRMHLDLDNQDIVEDFRSKSSEAKSFLEKITGMEIIREEIQAIEIILIEGLNFLPVADSNIEADHIKTNMQTILEEIQNRFDYNCIILLVDEFDILIRNIKGELPESVLSQLRDFLIWFSPEAFKGYHFIGALFSENIERLQEEKKSQTRIDAIYRRLLSQIILHPINKFESFYEKVYLPYLDRGNIPVNYILFDLDYLRFIFHACKKNFGTIFAILHEQYSSWQDEISSSYQRFLENPNEDKTDIKLFDIIWSEKGLNKHFFKRFIELISEKNGNERKSIFTYLIRNSKTNEAAPSYEKIKTDLMLNEKRIISVFHEDVASIEIFKSVFPYYEENFFINYIACFRLFNLSGLGIITDSPIVAPQGLINESVYFRTFMRKFTQRQYSDSPDKDWDVRVNEGFYYLIKDFLTNKPSPFEGSFDIRPLVNSFTLVDFIQKYGSQDMQTKAVNFEANIKLEFHNSFNINLLSIETRNDENTIDKVFLILLLPLRRNYVTKIGESFIEFFKSMIENVSYKNRPIESILIFSRFEMNYPHLEILLEKSDDSKCWLHLIDRIIPISVEFTTAIQRDIDETNFLIRRTSFDFFCAAFERLHNGYPDGESITYYESLFTPGNSEEAENNMLILQKLLTHLFDEYQGMYSTFSHNQIFIEEKRKDSDTPPLVSIQYFPNFIFNLLNLFNAFFPINDAGMPIRQFLDLPFKIGDFKLREFESYLKDLTSLSFDIPHGERRTAALTKKMSCFSTLIEMNLIRFSIDDVARRFSIRSDDNSLLSAFGEIVKDNTVINQSFDVTDIELECCKENSKGVEIIESFLDFLVANRKIFRHYE